MTLYLSGFFEHETLTIKNIVSLENASKITRKFIDKHDLGASSYDYGFITDGEKNLKYIISYNGRIFQPQDYFGKSSDKVSLNSWIGKIATKKFNYKESKVQHYIKKILDKPLKV